MPVVRDILWLLIGVAMGLLSLPTLGLAQTLFSWPDSRIDVGQYASIESCLAAAHRVRDSLDARSDTLFDTLPPAVNPGLRPVAIEIQTTAKRCMRRFPPATVPLAKFQLAQQLYLLAGQDGDAAQIIARRLDTIPATDRDQRASVLDSAIREYLHAGPLRLDSAQRLVDEWNGPTATITWAMRILILDMMLDANVQCGRAAMAQRYAHAILALAEARKDSLTDPGDQHWFLRAVTGANRLLYHDMLIDSLRTSTGAYANVKTQTLLGMGVTGNRFPSIQGDFVYPASAKGERLPRPGRLTLFATISGDQRMGKNFEVSRNALIRRLKQRFPELEIVLLAATTGTVVPLAPPSPEEEAAVFEKMLLEFHKLPATLIVNTRPFFRVENPDRRRVNQPMEIETQIPGLGKQGAAILVDTAGNIVEVLSTDPFPSSLEKRLFEFIQVVYDRDVTHAQKHAQANAQ